MKIVVDEDLPRSLTVALGKSGHEVFDIRDHGLRGKPDELVFAFAQQKEAVLFSADLGFSNILSFPSGSHYGIVILRFPNEMPTQVIVKEVLMLLDKILEQDFQGTLVILSPSQARMRRKA